MIASRDLISKPSTFAQFFSFLLKMLHDSTFSMTCFITFSAPHFLMIIKRYFLCPEGEKNTDLKFSLPKTVSRQNDRCIVNVWSLVKTVKNTDILFGRTYIILFLSRLSFNSASYYTNTVMHLLKKTNEHSLREGNRCFCTRNKLAMFRFTIFPTISIHCYRQIVKNTEIKLNRLVVKFNMNTNIPLELYYLIFTLTMSC